MSKKKEVGKGIRALLSNIEKTNNPDIKKKSVIELNQNAAMVPIDHIEANPFQPRTDFNSADLLELAKSIKVHGLIQPLTLRSLGGDTFQLISGERRLRASKMAGLHEIPAYIRTANDQEMLEMALVENIQRSNLNAVEIAISYQRLIEECKLTHEELSERVGKNRSTVSNYVRLLKLPPDIQSAIKDQKISMGHARAILGLEDLATQLKVFQEVLDKQLSVRATETLVKNYHETEVSSKEKKNVISEMPQEVVDFRDRISDVLGTKVQIKRDNKGKGQIVIKFSSDREFNNIMDALDGLEN